MKRKYNVKKIIIPALSALAFGVVSVGTTFALFTDKVETSVRVGTGVVNIETKVELVGYQSSVDGTDVTFDEGTTNYTNTLVGSSFALNGQAISIGHMVPGDKLIVKLTALNKSNVKTKTRYTLSHSKVGEQKDLFPALDLEYSIEGSALTAADIFRWKNNEAVPEANLATGVELNAIFVSIEFTDINEGILAREEGKNNQYQDAACDILLSLEALQGNAYTSPIDDINNYLRAEAMIEGQNITMYDAVGDVEEINYTIDDTEGYVYDIENDQFVAENSVLSNKYKYFKAYDEMPPTQDFSIYAKEADESWKVVNLNGVGFDAADEVTPDEVNYTNTTGSSRENIIIRTNSLDTAITVNAPTDTVKHYGSAKSVNIIAVAGESYHEFGQVALVDIANGRIALEESADVSRVHFTATSDVFNEITVAYDKAVQLPDFSRDSVGNIPVEGKLVVKLENDIDKTKAETDYIWLYQQGLVEQIRISENKETAGNVKATDEVVDTKTHKVANDLANEIKPSAQGSYTAETINAGLVATEDVTEKGIASEEKEEYFNEFVEEYISEEVTKDTDYLVRIGAKGFETFAAAASKVKTGETIRIIGNENVKVINAGKANVGDNAPYDFSGKVVTIHVDEDRVLDFGNTTNNVILSTNDSSTNTTVINFEGDGTVRYTGSQYSLIQQVNSTNNSKVTVKDVHFESEGSAGSIYDAKLEINSGYFKNVNFGTGTSIEGGYFTSNVGTYLVEGKMCVASQLEGYAYKVDELDEEHANFSVLHEGVYHYFTTLSKASDDVVSGDTLTFIGADDTVVLNQTTNRFYDTKGAIYDLNNHTIKGGNQYPINLLDLKNGESLTIKNGTVDVPSDYFCGVNDFTFSAINVEFADSLLSSVSSHTNSGIYVKSQTSYFSLKENAPSEYAVKIERASSSMYFVGNSVISEAYDLVDNGDHYFVYDSNPEAKIILKHLNDTITITKTDSIDFPVVEASGADVDVTGEGNTKTYRAIEAPVCYVGTTGYTTIEQGFANWTIGSTLSLNKDIIIDNYLDANLTSKGNGAFTFDLNGHTITYNVNESRNYSIKFTVNNHSLTLKDSKGTGGINKVGENCYNGLISFYNSSGSTTYSSTLSIDSGIYRNSSGFLIHKNGKKLTLTCTINGGTFTKNPVGNGNGSSITVNLGSGKTVVDNNDGTYSVK